MRLPLGSTAVSPSGGALTLISRRGHAWKRIAERELALRDALALLDSVDEQRTAHDDATFDSAVLSSAETAPRFAPGRAILWRYGRHIETARVIRDDGRGLVVWIPSGSARLQPVPSDGRRHRDIPLEERFRAPWTMTETSWTGPGVLRVAPSGRPWSIWFFQRHDGTPDGAYINLELPHRRLGGETPTVFTRDLVLDLWIDAEHPGSEDIWLKDADELQTVIEHGRFTAEQADAVRNLADIAGQELISAGVWPLDEGWATWQPNAAMDVPVSLPNTPGMDAARARSGSTSLDG